MASPSLAQEIEEFVTRQTARDPRVVEALKTGESPVSSDEKFGVLFDAASALYRVALRLASEVEALKQSGH